ncbi:MAG: B12-binding domain-containing radical SAM protein, partial [Candidatus Hodarchaeales archaeon]
MKILLLVPPINQDNSISKYQLAFLNFTAPPLGLGYIAAVLEENGYTKIKILDSQALGITPETYRKYLKRYAPDFLGIQSLTPNFKPALEAARIAKEENVPIVALGGYHPTAMPDESLLLSKGNVDLVFRGEAEFSVLEFVQKYEEGQDWRDINGISYLNS